MEKQLEVFKHPEFGELEVFILDNTELFNLEDVAFSLGYTKVAKDKTYLRQDRIANVLKKADVSTVVHDGQHFITEDGLYEFILEARTDAARVFRKWVTNEVLPMIRKTGMYVTDNVWEQINNDPARFGELLIQYGEAKKELEEKTKTLHILMHVNKTYTSTEIAKELGFKSATALNKDLGEKKIQFKQNGTWVLFSKYADKGYVDIKQEVLDNGRVIYHRRWTQTGREFLVKLYGGVAA